MPQESGDSLLGSARMGVARLGLALVAALLLLFGWDELRFLCDDAYIAFRYVAARREGWGYTWNPPPFPMVEGYTSFLWVLLLDLVWSIGGVEPPEAAPVLSLLATGGVAAIVAALLHRAPLPPSWEGARLGLVALGLALPLTNTTALAWASSGLETGLWMLLLAAWALSAVRGRGGWLGLFAGLLCLTRPDGLLFAALTAAWLGWRAARGEGRPWGLLGLLLPLAHLLWRRSTYGVWLPNPYYAKVGGWWPEAGLRHFALFVLEYGIFGWIAAFAAVAPRLRLPARSGVWLVGGALGLQLAYYTLRVGGDHFEHRIFVPVVWLGWAGLVAALPALGPPRRVFGLGALLLVLSWPISWTHHLRTRDLHIREQAHVLIEPVAPLLPALGPWARAWDGLQAWLIPRMVAVRHAEHRVLGALQPLRYPDPDRVRAGGLAQGGVVVASRLKDGVAHVDPRLDPAPALADFPAADLGVAGAGWFLFPMAVLDSFGLNDPVIARAGFRIPERVMAHEVEAPRGYLECFRTNAYLALILRRAETGEVVEVMTPAARWSRALDVRDPVLPPPEGREGLVAEPGVLLVVRDPPLGDAGVRACASGDWTGAPPPRASSEVEQLLRISRESAAARARPRGEVPPPSGG